MIARTVLAALAAGLVAGLLIAAVHHLRLSPLIAAAETYEAAAPASAAGHDHDEAAWKPEEGVQRMTTTAVSWTLTGMGFGLLVAGISMVTGLGITSRNAMIWGICGFLAATVAPAAGLAPELPGIPAADLMSRQLWWVGTAVATAGGIYLIAARRGLPWLLAALVLIALPHLIGAPQPISHESAVPPALAASFVGASIAVSALFWVLLGTALGFLLQNVSPEGDTP